MNNEDKNRVNTDRFQETAEQNTPICFSKMRLICALALLTVSLAAMLWGGYAWISSNKSVRSNDMDMQLGNISLFELATLKDGSQQGVYDGENLGTILKRYYSRFTSFINLPNLTVGESVYEYDGKQYSYGKSESISMMVNPGSNVSNTNEDQKLRPGVKGQFTFYIIPTSTDLDNVTVTVFLDPYTIEGSSGAGQITEVRNSSFASKQSLLNSICGHILLFEGMSGGNYTGRIQPTLSDNRIVFQLSPKSGFTANVPYPVTVYWIWPHTFEDMIRPGNAESVFASDCAEQNALVSWINSNKGFISPAVDDLENIDSASITPAQLLAWNNGYNQGDQLIGYNVAFFRWVVEAVNS